MSVQAWPPTTQNFGVGFLMLEEPRLPHRHHPAAISSALPILGKCKETAGWKCLEMCTIKSRNLIILTLKIDFSKQFQNDFFVYILFTILKTGISLLQPPAVTQEKGGGQRKKLHEV